VRVYLAICKSFKDCIFGVVIPSVRIGLLCIYLFCGEIYISHIKYASFKIGGVYDESIKK